MRAAVALMFAALCVVAPASAKADTIEVTGQITHAQTASFDVFLADADYTGSFEVAVYAGTIGGDAVHEVKRVTVPGNAWQSITIDLTAGAEQFFYLEVKEPSPDRMAWSAPIWIQRI